MAISKHRGLREHSHGKDLFFDFFFYSLFPLSSSQLFKHIMQKLGKNTTGKSPRRRRTSDESVKKGSSWKRKRVCTVDANLDSFFEKRETKANLVRDITTRKGRYGSFLHILLAGMS